MAMVKYSCKAEGTEGNWFIFIFTYHIELWNFLYQFVMIMMMANSDGDI